MKRKLKFMTLLLLLGITPVTISIIVSTLVSINKMTSSLEEGVYSRLETATTGLKEYYAFDIIDDGQVDLNNNYVDSLKDKGIELTLFEGNTRIATSIFKDGSTTERNVGTTASDSIYGEVKSGSIVRKDGVTIGGDNYYVVYQPIYDSNNEFWGMAFAGENQMSVDNDVNSSRNILIVLSIILITVSSVIIIILSLILKKPMVSAVAELNTLSDGYLNSNMDTTSSIQEINEIIQASKHLQFNLNNAITSVKSSSDLLTNTIANVDIKVEDTATNVGQISVAINEVADTSQSVAQSAQTLTDKADELGKDVEDLTENVRVLTKASDDIKRANEDASVYMKTVLTSSNESVNAVNIIAQEIADTNEAVSDIQSCVAVINEIASETKLLSLNASIEAARAGEAGRGFAVVAQNIKQLAESSSSNVEKITNIINKVTTLSARSVNEADRVKTIIQEEQKYITDAQAKFGILSTAVEHSIQEIESISTKTEALDALKSSLVNETSDLGAISEELGASAQEVSATCATVNTMCQDNKNQTEYMNNINNSLTEAVSFFK